MSNVSGAIKSIQDIMRKDAGVDGDDRGRRRGTLLQRLEWPAFGLALEVEASRSGRVAHDRFQGITWTRPGGFKSQCQRKAADPQGLCARTRFC